MLALKRKVYININLKNLRNEDAKVVKLEKIKTNGFAKQLNGNHRT